MTFVLLAFLAAADPLTGAVTPVPPVVPVAAAPETLPGPAAAPLPITDDPGETPLRSGGGDAFGADPGGFQAGGLSFRFLLQTRYSQTWADKSTNPYMYNPMDLSRSGSWAFREDYVAHKNDGWVINRFFMRMGATPTPTLGFKAIIDFAELVHNNADSAVKQAYVELKPIPRRLEITAGVFKVPFSTMELDPIASYELGSLGATDDLLKDLAFAGRAVGAQVRVAPLSKRKLLQLSLGAFGGNAYDEHASPIGAIAARVETRPVKFLTLGASFVDKPNAYTYERPFTLSKSKIIPRPDLGSMNVYARHLGAGKAAEVDASLKLGGFALRAEGLMGDRVDLDTRYGARKWMAVWGLAAYRCVSGPVDVMPAARFEWLDGDRDDAASGGRKIGSIGLNVIFNDSTRLLVDVSHTSVQAGSPLLDQPTPLPAQTVGPDGVKWIEHPYFELPQTKITVQLQVVM